MARTTQKTYSEKLRDPRWQKLRLEVMQRDGFACRHCDASEATLNVHHINYERGAEPWEYSVDQLITLCESCHTALEGKIRKARQLLAFCPHVEEPDIGMMFSILDGDGPYDAQMSEALKTAASAIWNSSGICCGTYDSEDFDNELMRFKCRVLEDASRFILLLNTSMIERELLARRYKDRGDAKE